MISCTNCKNAILVDKQRNLYNCDAYRKDDSTFIMSSNAITAKIDAKSIPNVCLDNGHFEAKELSNG